MIIYICDLCGATEKQAKNEFNWPVNWDRSMIDPMKMIQELRCGICANQIKKIFDEERIQYDIAVAKRVNELR